MIAGAGGTEWMISRGHSYLAKTYRVLPDLDKIYRETSIFVQTFYEI